MIKLEITDKADVWKHLWENIEVMCVPELTPGTARRHPRSSSSSTACTTQAIAAHFAVALAPKHTPSRIIAPRTHALLHTLPSIRKKNSPQINTDSWSFPSSWLWNDSRKHKIHSHTRLATCSGLWRHTKLPSNCHRRDSWRPSCVSFR